ncbi:MAG: zinc ABC transporter substrate-binding protein [Gaiellaceae bacterium MAG52_C11]|nr:zinc ABC transporter substrate-binding protein [Candidatus Gaiellasilicea maunaloa]
MVSRIVLALAIGFLLTGCGGDETVSGKDGSADVAAAFYPLAYAAERVGGAVVSVTNLTPPGTEPHDVELSARDVERVRSASVVLYLGSGFQPALEQAAEGASGETIDLLEGLDLRAAGTAVDPHVWLDPVRYARIVERIGTALDRPDEAARLKKELLALDGEFRAGLEDCERQELVTSHAAFGHLAERYGLEQIAISGLSPEAEPTAGELEQVIEKVREHGATTIFFETLVSPRLAQTVAREVGAETAVLNPLEGLTEEDIDAGADYFSLMRANLAALREALECR